MDIVTRLVDELIPYANNARTHSEEQVAQIAASIKEFGFTNPILTDGNNGIIAGHGRLLAARKLGMIEVPTIKLSHLSPAQKKAYILADNKLALNSGWDDELLVFELAELEELGFDVELTGFSDEEIDALKIEEIPEGLTDEDSVPDLPIEPVTKLGDVWILGKHRVMCGDSTSIDAVEKLMNGNKADICLCDPPYGISAVDKNSRMKQLGWTQYEGDKTIKTAVDAFNLCISICEQVVFWGGNHYANKIPNSCGWLVWDKQDGKDTLTYSMGELAWTNILKNVQIFTHTWDGFRKDSEKGIARIHPSQKPIALHEWTLNKIKTQSMNVLDLFGGSGSTLIACEKTNRINYSMELDPNYTDVIVKRFEQFTGKQATLESTGQTFNELSNG